MLLVLWVLSFPCNVHFIHNLKHTTITHHRRRRHRRHHYHQTSRTIHSSECYPVRSLQRK